MTGGFRCASGVTRAAAAALWLTAAACGRSSPTNSPAPAATEPTIDVVRVVARPIDVTLAMPGQLDPYESVAIYPKIAGFVKTIAVDRGSRVKAGDRLADLEAPELVAQRAEAQSKVQAAEAELAAAQAKVDADASTNDKLHAAASTPGVVAGNDLVIAQKTVDADNNRVAAARQNVEAARQALVSVSQMENYLHVVSPFDGVITERNVHPGALVGPSSGPDAATPMLRLVQDDRLRLVVPVPEAYIAGVAEGRTIAFTVPAYPDRTFTGTIARIAHAVDIKTRTMPVELDVANKDEGLAPGTYCQIQWPVHRPSPSLLVPFASVTNTTDRTFVIRVRDGKTEWVDVKTGLTSGPLAEVFGNLHEGDLVAVRGTDELRPEVAVHTREVKPAS